MLPLVRARRNAEGAHDGSALAQYLGLSPVKHVEGMRLQRKRADRHKAVNDRRDKSSPGDKPESRSLDNGRHRRA
jgi:hypothetical protein